MAYPRETITTVLETLGLNEHYTASVQITGNNVYVRGVALVDGVPDMQYGDPRYVEVVHEIEDPAPEEAPDVDA